MSMSLYNVVEIIVSFCVYDCWFFGFLLSRSLISSSNFFFFGKLMAFLGQLIYFVVNLRQLKPTNLIFYNYITFLRKHMQGFLVFNCEHFGDRMCSFPCEVKIIASLLLILFRLHNALMNLWNFVVTRNEFTRNMWEELINWFPFKNFYFIVVFCEEDEFTDGDFNGRILFAC